jgi:hypothetical protein
VRFIFLPRKQSHKTQCKKDEAHSEEIVLITAISHHLQIDFQQRKTREKLIIISAKSNQNVNESLYAQSSEHRPQFCSSEGK